MKDGAFLSEFSPEPFFKIQSVHKIDAGSYQCYARNEAGTIVSEKIPVTVARKSSLGVLQIVITNIIIATDMSSFPSSPGQTLRVELGHAAVFEFPALSSEPTPSVSWQTDDGTVLYGAKYAVTNDNRLVVLNVDYDDQKKYR